VEQVLAWADAEFQRSAKWPHSDSGPIVEQPQETWSAINHALTKGRRGLPGGSSLAKLLHAERGVPNHMDLPPFTRKQILAWATTYYRRTRKRPTKGSGSLPGTSTDTWSTVDTALRDGLRGLPGSSSLARLLAEHSMKRNVQDLPPLTKKQIVGWGQAHQQRTQRWPNVNSEVVVEASEEKCNLIDNALRNGHRGLPGGSSLAQLLQKKCGVRNPAALPNLSEEQILGGRISTSSEWGVGPITSPDWWQIQLVKPGLVWTLLSDQVRVILRQFVLWPL
jgi:hypothetical protein